MSDHIEVLQAMLNEEASRLSLQNYEREAIKAAISSLRQVPDAKPLADRLHRESECTAEAAHHFYAQGWNACRDAIANPAPPTSGMAQDSCDECQEPGACDGKCPGGASATPAQAGAVGNGERWLRSLIGTLDADADTLMLLAAQRITGGAQSGVELPELPELPEPAGVLVINGQALRWFTADQMREMYRRGLKDAGA